MEPEKIILTTQLKIVDAPKEEPGTIFKTIAEAGKYWYPDKFGKDGPQPDLLYLENVFVTQGFNNNDDFFEKNELWKARKTPALKPINWGHTDAEIIGVKFGVAARDLALNALDINSDKLPDKPFELLTHGAIYQFIFPERAEEIKKRFKDNRLFSSMEAWFDDYSYIIQKDNSIVDVVDRNQTTAFLDSYLRAKGGAGKYKGLRIGRGLKNITFGGEGIVEYPANPRSIITVCESYSNNEIVNQQDGSILLGTFHKQQVAAQRDATAKQGGVKMSEELKAVAGEVSEKISKLLDEKERARSAEELNRLLANAKNELDNVRKENEELRKSIANTKNVLVEDVDRAFATALEAAAPAEIKRIDQAIKVGGGDAVYKAKLAFLNETMQKSATRASEVDSLRQENEQLKKEVALLRSSARSLEIDSLFSNILEENEVNTLKSEASNLSDESYTAWLARNKMWAEKTMAAYAKMHEDEEEDKQMMQKMMKEKKKGKGGEHAYEAALPQSAEEWYSAEEDGLLKGGSQKDLGYKSGVKNVPLRFKLSGSEAAEEVLDTAKAEAGTDLSNSDGGNSEDYNPMENVINDLFAYRTKASQRSKRGLPKEADKN